MVVTSQSHSLDDNSIEVFACESGEYVSLYEFRDANIRVAKVGIVDQHVFGVGSTSLTKFSNSLQSAEMTQGWWYAPFASAGTVIAFPTEDHDVKIIDIASGDTSVIELDNSISKVFAIDLSSDARRIAIACNHPKNRREISVWDTDRKERIFGTDRFVNCWTLRFSPADANVLLLSTNDESELLNVATKEINKFAGGGVLAAEFAADGERLLLGGSTFGSTRWEKVSLWSIGPGSSAVRERAFKVAPTYAVAMKSDGIGFAVLVWKKGESVRLWDGTTESPVSPINISSPRVLSIDFSPSDECLVAASPAGEITFIDPQDGIELGVFRVDRPLRHIKFMDGCDRLVVSTMDGAILHWDY